MKKIISAALLLLLLGGLCGCRSEEATTAEPARYIEFLEKEESEIMKPEEAAKVLQAENADPATQEYREAAYSFNKSTVAAVIKEAQDTQKKTPEVTEVFEGVFFRFLNGEAKFENDAVRKKLIKLGLWEKAEGSEEWYVFTFHDRTLAQASVNMTKGQGVDHSLNEYADVLELLLSEPNVTVQTFLENELGD
ncbi:MAG: hypothetical protein IJN82_02960 [Clostridia bacterium]|nr:hypothetical protein [Clostridia bacterium]